MSKETVFKKQSKDKSVTVYLTKRDFVDHVDAVDPVDGVVLIDHSLVTASNVYVTLSCTFRYGYVDAAGIPFKRDLYHLTRQVYPELQDKLTHTETQKGLLKKLGNNAYPFFFEFPDNLPCSVWLQPGPNDVGKKCAVEFEVRAFSGDNKTAPNDRANAVGLALRKIQYAPTKTGVAPSAEMIYEFLMSDKPLTVKATLGKETYYHGEPVKVNVEITNMSKRNIKNIRVAVEQKTKIVLYYNDKYIKAVAEDETDETVPSGGSMKKEFALHPVLSLNKDRRGLALDGNLKHQDTNLASSSIVKEEVLKEVQGILVSYKVVVRMTASAMVGSSDVVLEVPFKLMHPKPKPPKSTSGDMTFEEFARAYFGAGSGIGGGRTTDDEED